MAMSNVRGNEETLVRQYFDLIRELRTRVEGAPERLRDMWDEDGTFEFAGAPPVTGVFHGANAIYVLYKNRFGASGMPVRLEGAGEEEKTLDTALGKVDTDVHRVKVTGEGRAVAGWSTLVATESGEGFQVAGSHSFQFRSDKISKLKVVISPRPHEAEGLRMQGLGVDDIGRLALAAWAVV